MTETEDRLAAFRESAEERLALLYGSEQAAAVTDQLMGLLNRYQPAIYHHTRAPEWDETDNILITYGDAIRNREEPVSAATRTFSGSLLPQPDQQHPPAAVLPLQFRRRLFGYRLQTGA